MFATLRPTSPAKFQKRAKDAQWLLSGHNRWKQHPYKGKLDSQWGEASGHAADRMRYWLGYPRWELNGVFGDQLYRYLTGKSRLPVAYQLRRKARLAKRAREAKRSKKGLALARALSQVGQHEIGYSNITKYGAWYGLNGEPWCAIFCSWAYAPWYSFRTALARQFWYWGMRGTYGLRVTQSPEPGDNVVYDSGEGHTGIFKRWLIVGRRFEAVEGNTSCSGGSWNNGGEVCVQDRDFSRNPKFIRVP